MKWILPPLLLIFSVSAFAISRPRFQNVEFSNGFAETPVGQGEVFYSYYEDFTPRNWDGQKTLFLIPGFSKDVTYFYDYLRNTQLLQKGYRLILADPMLRGRNLNKNFPIQKQGGRYKFELTDQYIQRGFNQPSAANEALRFHSILKHLGISSVSLLAHSRGALLAGALGRMIENSSPIHLESAVILNGFVSYISLPTPSESDLRLHAQEMALSYRRLDAWYDKGTYTDSNLTAELRQKALTKGEVNSDENHILSDYFGRIAPTFGVMDARFKIIEDGFINHVYKDYDQRPNRGGQGSKSDSLSFRTASNKRERSALESMLYAQRSILREKTWVPNFNETRIILPVTALEDFNNMKAPIYSIIGGKDELVSTPLSQLYLHLDSDLTQVLIPEDDHFGPERERTTAISASIIEQHYSASKTLELPSDIVKTRSHDVRCVRIFERPSWNSKH